MTSTDCLHHGMIIMSHLVIHYQQILILKQFSEIRYDEAVTTEKANLNECIENIKKDMDKFKRFSDSIYDQFFSFFLDAMPKAENAPVENRHTTAFVKKITLFLSDEKYYD